MGGPPGVPGKYGLGAAAHTKNLSLENMSLQKPHVVRLSSCERDITELFL
jgi:hypothetical protein